MKKTLGFSLIEVLIMIAIVMILSAIAIPNFIRARERSQAKKQGITVEQLQAQKQGITVEQLRKQSIDTTRIINCGEGVYRFNYNLYSEADKFQVALVEFRRSHSSIV